MSLNYEPASEPLHIYVKQLFSPAICATLAASPSVFLNGTDASSRPGPVDPSFRAFSGRLKFTVRRHKFNKDSLSPRPEEEREGGRLASGFSTVLSLDDMVDAGVLLSVGEGTLPPTLPECRTFAAY